MSGKHRPVPRAERARLYDRKLFAVATGPALDGLLRQVGPCAEAVTAARAAQRDGMGIGAASLRLLGLLDVEGPRPVPELASRLGVSRQAVQPLVEAGIAAGRIEMLPNARKRRSPLARLTEQGRVALLGVRAREEAFADWMAARFLESDVAIARRVLDNLVVACGDAASFEAARAKAEAQPDPVPAPPARQKEHVNAAGSVAHLPFGRTRPTQDRVTG